MKKLLSYKKRGIVSGKTSVLILILSMEMMVLLGGCSCGPENESQQSTGGSEAETAFQTSQADTMGDASASLYMPGIYTGSARGYGGRIEVTVKVDENRILAIAAIGDSETEGVGKVALEKLPALIVEANSTDIDGVSGATYSSQGLFEAVNDALAQAYTGS